MNFKRIFLEKKIPIPVVAVVIGILFISLLSIRYQSPKVVSAPIDTTPCNNNINIFATKGNTLIRPLYMLEIPEQSKSLGTIKENIQQEIKFAKDSNQITNASIYLLKLNSGDWIGINENENYNSTGYIRLAVLISLLKASELNPSILNKKVEYVAKNQEKVDPDNKAFTLKSGTYEIRDLMKYMILYPDTNSKSLLTPFLDKQIFEKLFADLRLELPDLEHRKYKITVREYSRFLHLLYNGKYLREENSEYALTLLSQSFNKKGITAELPNDIKVIHKLSEKFTDNEYEMRESGIIYINNDSYLITIFAKGVKSDQLDAFAGRVAKNIYDQMHS